MKNALKQLTANLCLGYLCGCGQFSVEARANNCTPLQRVVVNAYLNSVDVLCIGSPDWVYAVLTDGIYPGCRDEFNPVGGDSDSRSLPSW
jgi:hypothetical protein